MQLTTQMLVEMKSIQTRVCRIQEILFPMITESVMTSPDNEGIETRHRKIRASIAELNPYKVRFENMLCETDVKEQAHSHLNQVIRFSSLLAIRILQIFNTIMYTLMSLCKNERLYILKQLLRIEERLFECKYVLDDELNSVSTDDLERYLKMAMRLDSNDPAILHRKKKEIIGE